MSASLDAKLTDADRPTIVTPERYRHWWFGNFYFANVRFMVERAQ